MQRAVLQTISQVAGSGFDKHDALDPGNRHYLAISRNQIVVGSELISIQLQTGKKNVWIEISIFDNLLDQWLHCYCTPETCIKKKSKIKYTNRELSTMCNIEIDPRPSQSAFVKETSIPPADNSTYAFHDPPPPTLYKHKHFTSLVFTKETPGPATFRSFLAGASSDINQRNTTRSLDETYAASRRRWSSYGPSGGPFPGYITVAEGACPRRQGDFEKSHAA